MKHNYLYNFQVYFLLIFYKSNAKIVKNGATKIAQLQYSKRAALSNLEPHSLAFGLNIKRW